MTDPARNPDDYCYRHPDRLSFVLCERCGRTICLECQNHVDGRVLCPDDANARVTQIGAARKPKPKRRLRAPVIPAALENHPVVTYLILALGLFLFLVDLIAQGFVMPHLWVLPTGVQIAGAGDVLHQPWSILTSIISTSGILSVLLGGFSLYSLGRFVERFLGRSRFIILFVGSGVGASLVSFLLDGAVTSWFGAIFGIAVATIVFARRLGVQPIFLYVSAGITVILSLFFGSWQAVLGSILAGGGIGFYYYFEDDVKLRNRIRLAVAVGGAVVLVLGVVRAVVTRSVG